MRPRSQADSAAQAPHLSWRVPTLIGPFDDPDEKTAIDSIDARLMDAPPKDTRPMDAQPMGAQPMDAQPMDTRIELLVVRRIDDRDEATVIDAVEPDNEPTAIRPTIVSSFPAEPTAPATVPILPRPRTRMARGSSHGLAPGSLGHIGKYELRERLGRGAFGVVFTARDPSLDRDVAVKVLRPTHLANQEIVQRFLQEARATARIAHPGIVTIHDCGQVETNLGVTAFIVMELLTGESLARRLTRSGRLLPETAAEIARQVASALEMAHRVDVLHRDLKPDNIYLVPDPAIPSGERVKILDFGLAKLGREGHTQIETVFGTPRYMSPEQCRSATQIDHRSDIYSLGCVLFELVTGCWPFQGDVRQLVEQHQRAIPPRARSLVPDLPPALDDLIAEMLAKDPMQRPQTMGAVQRALQHLVGGQPPVAEVPPASTDLLAQPPERPAIPAPVVAASGELLVPASGGHQALGPPTASPPVPGQPGGRAPLVARGMAGVSALAVAVIALLLKVWAAATSLTKR